MLTDAMRADGWIEHDGGPCPVGLQDKVQVLFRTGEIRHPRRAEWWTAFDTVTGFADHDLWRHQSSNHDNDIIAYRPEKPHD